jgi:hypothetical protein
MFTFLGKTLALLNVALSLLLAGLAFGLFATGIDWSDNAAKQGKPEGETLVLRKQLQKEIGQVGFKGVLQQAEKSQGAARSWEAARVGLWGAEEYRGKVRPEYAKRLQGLVIGPGPAQEVELVNHLPSFDARTNFLKMKEAEHNGQPLRPRVSYLKDIGLQRGESFDLDGKLVKQYKDDVKHTDKIVGDKDKKGSDPGLLALLERDRDKREGLEEERRLIESQDVNTKIDAAAVNRSYGSVLERIEELEKFLAKRGATFTKWEEKNKAAKKD